MVPEKARKRRAKEMEVHPVALTIVEACRLVAAEFPLGAREQVVQSALEAELQLARLTVRREVPVPIIYRDMPLGHDARGREDLVVIDGDAYFILELKQGARLAPKDFQQLYRYMIQRTRERRHVHGMLVLFGETHTEVWYARAGETIERVMLLSSECAATPVVTHQEYTVTARP